MVAPIPESHSSAVRLDLYIGMERFALSQMGEGCLFFENDVVLPGTAGELVAKVDSHEERWEVKWEKSDAPRKKIAVECRALE
jgi:hypothetical protein